MKTTMTEPLDIRLMRRATYVLTTVAALLLLIGAARWLVGHPLFAVEAITVQGEVTRNNALTLRANVLPQLRGNFFTIDLERASEAFRAVPWVRSAVVHRDFPNRLRVVLQEHHVLALWGDENSSKMVNQQNQVFEANMEDLDVEVMPRLSGSDEQSQTVIQMYRHLLPMFAELGMEIKLLKLTARGSWFVQTESGADIELGRGSQSDITARLRMLAKTLPQVLARYNGATYPLLGVDLRHKEGYALRLKGVSTSNTNGLSQF